MDKSAITFTRGSEWWLERVTMRGHERYPKIIRVGELGKERVYVPERTCRNVDGHCSKCGGWVNVCDYFCPRCGARIEGAAS